MSDTEMGSDSFERPARPTSPAKRRAGEMENGVQDSIEVPETQETQHGSFVTASIENAVTNNTPASSTQETSASASIESNFSATFAALPSIDEQVARVSEMWQHPLEEGDRGVVVSGKWLQRVLARTTENLNKPEFPKHAREGDVGKFDTSDIVPADAYTEPILHDAENTAYIPLSPGVTVGSEIEILPYTAYGLIVGWYGAVQGQKPIIRYAHNSADAEAIATNMIYELNPPVFTIRTSTTQKQIAAEDKPKSATMALKLKQARRALGQLSADDAVQLVSSRTERFQKFLARAKEHAGIPTDTKVKIYRIKTPQQTGRAKLVVDKQELDSLDERSELEEVSAKDETANDKYNGSSNMLMHNLTSDATLVLVEQSDARKSIVVKKAEIRQSSPASGVVTRGRAARSGRTRGVVGLNNLGNTCYMNSALQCIRSVEELAAYFLSGHYKQEINTSNPLGHKGAMATKYDGVLKGVYNDASSSSFSPSAFKSTLSRCMPTFSGWGQQDSQEFLSFLVDALHEDLNRIEKKPYLEAPDSDDAKVQDPEYIQALGEVYRNQYRARNDSVIMDLFSGFYKNTMECPVCDKISVTFDPYSLLTLQLPIANTVTYTFTFIPLQGRPVKHELDVEKSFTVRDLKHYVVSKHEGVDSTKLWMAEIYGKKIYKVFSDATSMADSGIQTNDDIYIFEVEYAPTYLVSPVRGYPTKREPIPSMDSEQANVLTVPIIHRAHKSIQRGGILHPQYISLTRDEAKDLDVIKDKVLRQVAQLTTRDILSEQSIDASADDSAEEPHVSDHSGEDDYVKISLEKAADMPANASTMMYCLNYAKSSDGGHCASMSSFSEHTVHPLDSRIKLPSRRSSITSATTEVSSAQEDESQDGLESSPAPVEEPASSLPDADEDDIQSGRRRSGKGNKFKGNSKGNKEKQQQRREKKALRQAKPIATPLSEQDYDQPYYIQIGECIVVEWAPESFDELFGRDVSDADDKRGSYVWDLGIETIEDPIVAANKARREHRKKHGISLEDCFVETGKREKLSQDNAWYCGRCKELREATKTLEIWTLPDILVLHLKRFGGNRRFNDKLDTKVDYPIQGLDLNSKIGLKDGKDYTYDLFAVDLHYGGLGGGHYVADAKSFIDGQWYHFNDSSASLQRGDPTPQAAAYLLFYRRRSEKPLGPEILQDLVYKFRATSEADESGEEQLDGRSSTLPGSSSNSAGIIAKIDNRDRTANADGSIGAVGNSLKTSRLPTTTDDDDEGIGMDDDDDDEEEKLMYGPTRPPHLLPYSGQIQDWTFNNLKDDSMPDEGDNDSTLAQNDGGDEWNDQETSFQIGSDKGMEEDDDNVTNVHLS